MAEQLARRRAPRPLKGVPLLLCALLIVGGCRPQEPAPGPNSTAIRPAEPSPTSEDSDHSPPTGPSSPPPGPTSPRAANYDHPKSADHVLAWLDEVPGYVPMEVAELYHKYPRRFELRGDGTVTYRDDQFRHFQVRLSAEELKVLVQRLVDTGYMALNRPMAASRQVLIADAGGVTLGLALTGESQNFTITALTYMARLAPEDLNLAVCKSLRDILHGYQHPRARPHTP